MKKLTQDNSDKLTVVASVDIIEYHAKVYFKWRSSTKKYSSIFNRLMACGSSEYDNFILYLHKLGY